MCEFSKGKDFLLDELNLEEECIDETQVRGINYINPNDLNIEKELYEIDRMTATNFYRDDLSQSVTILNKDTDENKEKNRRIKEN